MLPPGPPLLLLLLFLAGLPMGLWGCLQCDAKFKENLAKLRTELIQRQIHDTRLKARAESLLKGLAGDFFLHYATSQFSGYAVKSKVDALIHEVRSSTENLAQSSLTDQALLDELVQFRRKTTMKLKVALKEHQTKACDQDTCVDSQDRLSLRYGRYLPSPNIAQTGVAIVLCMGGLLFLVSLGVILAYWRNQLYAFV